MSTTVAKMTYFLCDSVVNKVDGRSGLGQCYDQLPERRPDQPNSERTPPMCSAVDINRVWTMDLKGNDEGTLTAQSSSSSAAPAAPYVAPGLEPLARSVPPQGQARGGRKTATSEREAPVFPLDVLVVQTLLGDQSLGNMQRWTQIQRANLAIRLNLHDFIPIQDLADDPILIAILLLQIPTHGFTAGQRWGSARVVSYLPTAVLAMLHSIGGLPGLGQDTHETYLFPEYYAAAHPPPGCSKEVYNLMRIKQAFSEAPPNLVVERDELLKRMNLSVGSGSPPVMLLAAIAVLARKGDTSQTPPRLETVLSLLGFDPGPTCKVLLKALARKSSALQVATDMGIHDLVARILTAAAGPIAGHEVRWKLMPKSGDVSIAQSNFSELVQATALFIDAQAGCDNLSPVLEEAYQVDNADWTDIARQYQNSVVAAVLQDITADPVEALTEAKVVNVALGLGLNLFFKKLMAAEADALRLHIATLIALNRDIPRGTRLALFAQFGTDHMEGNDASKWTSPLFVKPGFAAGVMTQIMGAEPVYDVIEEDGSPSVAALLAVSVSRQMSEPPPPLSPQGGRSDAAVPARPGNRRHNEMLQGTQTETSSTQFNSDPSHDSRCWVQNDEPDGPPHDRGDRGSRGRAQDGPPVNSIPLWSLRAAATAEAQITEANRRNQAMADRLRTTGVSFNHAAANATALRQRDEARASDDQRRADRSPEGEAGETYTVFSDLVAGAAVLRLRTRQGNAVADMVKVKQARHVGVGDRIIYKHVDARDIRSIKARIASDHPLDSKNNVGGTHTYIRVEPSGESSMTTYQSRVLFRYESSMDDWLDAFDEYTDRDERNRIDDRARPLDMFWVEPDSLVLAEILDEQTESEAMFLRGESTTEPLPRTVRFVKPRGEPLPPDLSLRESGRLAPAQPQRRDGVLFEGVDVQNGRNFIEQVAVARQRMRDDLWRQIESADEAMDLGMSDHAKQAYVDGEMRRVLDGPNVHGARPPAGNPADQDPSNNRQANVTNVGGYGRDGHPNGRRGFCYLPPSGSTGGQEAQDRRSGDGTRAAPSGRVRAPGDADRPPTQRQGRQDDRRPAGESRNGSDRSDLAPRATYPLRLTPDDYGRFLAQSNSVAHGDGHAGNALPRPHRPPERGGLTSAYDVGQGGPRRYDSQDPYRYVEDAFYNIAGEGNRERDQLPERNQVGRGRPVGDAWQTSEGDRPREGGTLSRERGGYYSETQPSSSKPLLRRNGELLGGVSGLSRQQVDFAAEENACIMANPERPEYALVGTASAKSASFQGKYKKCMLDSGVAIRGPSGVGSISSSQLWTALLENPSVGMAHDYRNGLWGSQFVTNSDQLSVRSFLNHPRYPPDRAAASEFIANFTFFGAIFIDIRLLHALDRVKARVDDKYDQHLDPYKPQYIISCLWAGLGLMAKDIRHHIGAIGSSHETVVRLMLDRMEEYMLEELRGMSIERESLYLRKEAQFYKACVGTYSNPNTVRHSTFDLGRTATAGSRRKGSPPAGDVSSVSSRSSSGSSPARQRPLPTRGRDPPTKKARLSTSPSPRSGSRAAGRSPPATGNKLSFVAKSAMKPSTVSFSLNPAGGGGGAVSTSGTTAVRSIPAICFKNLGFNLHMSTADCPYGASCRFEHASTKRPFRLQESKDVITRQLKGVVADIQPYTIALGKEINARNPLFAK